MRPWLYPMILCLAGASAVSGAAPPTAGGSFSAIAGGVQPGWRFRVTRSFEYDGQAWRGEESSPIGIALELEFIEEITAVAEGLATRVVRNMVGAKAEKAATGGSGGLAKSGEEYELRFQGEEFELIDRHSGNAVTSMRTRNSVGWPLALDLWPTGQLEAGQAWSFHGGDLARRLAMLEVRHGRLDLRVERIQREPRTGLDTAHIRGRLVGHIPFSGVPALYNARVEIDLPLALGIPFRMEFNGRFHGEGQVADSQGRIESAAIDTTYRVAQRVSPARAVLAALQAAPTPAPAAPIRKTRPVPPAPVPAAPIPTRQARPTRPLPAPAGSAPVAKSPPVPPTPLTATPPEPPPVRLDPTLDKRDERGATALMMAALNGELTEMRILLRRGADPDALDNRGYGVLVYAGSSGKLEALRLLLANGANPDVRSPDGDTPIIALATWKDIHGKYGEMIHQAIRILLDANADVNAADHDGNIALMFAAHVNNARLVKLLLERGAEPTLMDKEGMTARRIAETLGNRDVLPLLPLDPRKTRGGDQDLSVDAREETGATRLMRAAVRGETETVKDLLRRGADPKARDNAGRNPAFYATVGSEPEILRLLLEKGSDPNQRSESGKVPLAVLASSKEFAGENAAAYLATVEALLNGGADPNVRYNDEMTPLMYAALNGNTGMIRLLLKHGADINAKNKDGATAVVIAHTFGHRETVEMLLEAGTE